MQYDAVPETIRPLRRLFRDLGPLRNDPRIRLLMAASEISMATTSIKKHENKGLRNAIALKKKAIKGKRLNVLGREEGGAQLFGPEEIQTAKQASIAKAQADLAVARERVINKQLAVLKKQQAKCAKEERREERAANAQLKADQKNSWSWRKKLRK
ncbi:MAG: hypothetical protein MMC33_010005 [Icmadophila ericetorum]|nr:hypothetical protein [Icmadophila ericetorum]